jgi:hypothetical protein
MPQHKGAASERKPLSLPKSTAEAAIVHELVSLLEKITAGGRVADEGITALQTWLTSHDGTGLPGVELLRTTVTQILADGTVTPEERAALYSAIERVLPPETRRGAKERRTAVELLAKETVRGEKAASKERERQERLRNRPIASANFMVAGVQHEGRARTVERYATADDPVHLIRDPNNAYDSNAIEIRLSNGMQIGFVPRENAAVLARVMDSGCKYEAYLTKILDGREAPIPVVQAYLYRLDATIAEHGEPLESSKQPSRSELPSTPVNSTLASSGNAGGRWIFFLLGTLVALLVLFKACSS